MERPKPSPIQINKRHIFLNGDTSLTPIGSSIQFITIETGYLEAVKRKALKDEKGKLVTISEERQKIMEEGIIERFTEISEKVGFPADPRLLPDLVDQYNGIVGKRRAALARLNKRTSPPSEKVAVGAK